MQRLIQAFFLLCVLLTTPPTAVYGASIVELPLFLRTQILQNALVESLTPQPGRPTVLFQQGSYNYLHISEPQLSIRDGQLYFNCNAAAGMGFDSLGLLPSAVNWKGSVLMKLTFYVDDQWQLRYRIIESAIYNEQGGKPVVTGFAWELSKRFLHPRLEQFAFDLAMPKQDIILLLRACVAAADIAPLEAALNTLTVGTLRNNTDGLIVPLLLTVADTQTQAPTPLPAQLPLGFEELEKLQQAFEPLDAFLVFVIKNLSGTMGDSLYQEQLFDLLITSRYQLLMILTGQTPIEDEDPLRLLFIDVWQQLRPIIENSNDEDGLMQNQLLRYMTFLNAGDALLALDTAAPGLGIHITSDGLRRLARMLQPNAADPLHFDWQVDPSLRELFQFQPEGTEQKTQDSLPQLPPELLLELPQQESPAEVLPEQESAPDTTPELPSQELSPDFPPELSPQEAAPDFPQSSTTGRRLVNFLVGVAAAAEPPAPTVKDLNKRLNQWVPKTEELDKYGQIIGNLLATSAREQIKKAGLDPRYANIYQHLIPATAMIESCWKQYSRKDNKIEVLRSSAGGLGIMQINQHVWRGFYDIERLQNDVIYNIEAGNQIMMRYFKQHGTKVAKENNNPELAARAAYATYNGGPRASRRFLKADASPRQKRVDEHLWTLYQKAAAGGSAHLATCSIL